MAGSHRRRSPREPQGSKPDAFFHVSFKHGQTTAFMAALDGERRPAEAVRGGLTSRDAGRDVSPIMRSECRLDCAQLLLPESTTDLPLTRVKSSKNSPVLDFLKDYEE